MSVIGGVMVAAVVVASVAVIGWVFWLALTGRGYEPRDRAEANLGEWLRVNYPQATDEDERIVTEANRHDT